MSIWDLRMWIEQNTPAWVLLIPFIVAIVLIIKIKFMDEE